jgi:hypothetical protein
MTIQTTPAVMLKCDGQDCSKTLGLLGMALPLREPDKQRIRSLGWTLNQDMTLLCPHGTFGETQSASANARRSDPRTSQAAARSVDPRNMTEIKHRILGLFLDRGRMTRRELVAAYRERFLDDKVTDQSLRSRVAELVAMPGSALVDRGEKRGPTGRMEGILGHIGAMPGLF